MGGTGHYLVVLSHYLVELLSTWWCSGDQFTIPGVKCSGNQRAGHRKLRTLQDIPARFQNPDSQTTSVPDPSPVRQTDNIREGQPGHCRTFQPACLSSLPPPPGLNLASTWPATSAATLASSWPASLGSRFQHLVTKGGHLQQQDQLQQPSQVLQQASHCNSSHPSPTGSAAALPGSAAGLPLQ